MDKIIDITERVPTMRKKRKRRKNTKFMFLLALFLAIILLLLYFQSSFSDISKIEIKGEQLLTQEQYIEEMNLQQGQSLWSFNTKELEQALQQKEWVKEVNIERKWPNIVQVSIQEWKKVAYIAEGSTFYPILENGYIFENADDLQPVDAPIFINFEDVDLRKRILKQLAQLKPEVMGLISQIGAMPTDADPYAVQLFMNDGYEVRAEISTLAEKLNFYPSIVALIEAQQGTEKGIIDIEVGSYYRSFSKEYGFDIQLDDAEQETDESE